MSLYFQQIYDDEQFRKVARRFHSVVDVSFEFRMMFATAVFFV